MQDEEIFERAVRAGDAATVARMLRAAPGLARPRGEGASDPVALAARHGRLEVLRLLVEAGGLPAAEGDRPTALMQAAAAGDAAAVALLLERGADPASQDAAGRTAADHAGEAGHAEVAQGLKTAAEAERILR
ncbi:ankyrin repeat domain-containing protein [Paracraurococcus lichenis]|uniref:Ankyrin repeat domain-containing protein n=1 Tax=Paracraurococcus lichenis TaxID=3064888 RepID=A0ABT9DX79_9PROT|nr:ankyrin repeat domain-containing protein [Paracraurococcus sp. LOR1-02]MDO9708504.1 ankyrin repeat domain-containing protein [Paracraurococcus sp. LOR1-02]